MTDAFFAVQQAVANTLTANATVQTLLGAPVRLYDHAPPAALFPYAVFGDLQVGALDTKTETGFEHTLTLHIWSRYRGTQEAKDIAQSFYDALHRATLTVTGHVFLSCEFHSADFTTTDEGLTTEAAVRFKIVTQST